MKSLLLLALPLLLHAQDPRDIVRRSLDENERIAKLSENYTFTERRDERMYDGDGKVKKRKLETYDVTLSEGSPYNRLIARDDKPLSPAEERKEDEKLRKAIEQRRKETPEQRAKRIEEWRRKRAKQRDMLKDILDAFDFTMAGEEHIENRRVHVIDAIPRPGFKPRNTAGKFLAKLKGRLWIDAEDYTWVRLDAEVLDNVSLGLFLAKVSKGTRLTIDQTRVNGEIWLPKHVESSASGRVIFSRFTGTWNLTYTNYRKFQAESRVVSTEPVEEH